MFSATESKIIKKHKHTYTHAHKHRYIYANTKYSLHINTHIQNIFFFKFIAAVNQIF